MMQSPPAVALRPYQEAAIAAVTQAHAAGQHTALVTLPTGTGKTIVFSEIVRRWDAPTLLLAHREELLTQAREKLLMVWPAADVGIVGAGYNETGHRVTIGSVQALSRPKRLAWLAGQDVQLVICDEAHHSLAATYRRVFEALHAGDAGGAFLLGVTATPDRGDGGDLGDLYGTPVYEASLPSMVRDGYLCDLRGLQVKTQLSLDAIRTRAGDFAEDELAAVVNTRDRNQVIVDAWQRHAADRPTLIFAVNVAHAYALADTFRDAGIAAAAVDGTMPRENRQQLLADFAAGYSRVLCNCALFTEGVDIPHTSCLVLARPTQSRSLYAQMVGRGTRIAPGKADCLVLDITDNSERHSLTVQSLPTLIGRKYQEKRHGTEDERDDEDEFSVREALTAALPTSGRIVERDVSLLGQPFAWKPTGDGHYRLLLTEQGVTVWLVLKSAGYVAGVVWRDGERQELTAQPMPLDWAQVVAERAAAQIARGQIHLVDRRASWRNAPASVKQLALLKRLGCVCRAGLSKGEASQLIDRAMAKQSA